MGAYYEYQITRRVDNKVQTVGLPVWGGLKFLEGFHSGESATVYALALIRHYGTAIINTVCDYDEPNTFKYQVPYGRTYGNEYDENLTNFERSLIDVLNETSDTDWMFLQDSLHDAYLVCAEKKQFVDMNRFFEEGFTISPLALLTRNSRESQGGGDYFYGRVVGKYNEFHPNPNFDPELVTTWKDCELSLSFGVLNDTYEDITEKIFLKENI